VNNIKHTTSLEENTKTYRTHGLTGVKL